MIAGLVCHTLIPMHKGLSVYF